MKARRLAIIPAAAPLYAMPDDTLFSPDKSPRKRAQAPSLSEQAYVAIKGKILTQELRSGDQINVAQLCAQLELGRSPVHQAILRLGEEGLVDVLPRKGILVKGETLDSFLELIAARLLVEPHLTALAVERATPGLIERLEAILAMGWEHHRNQDRLGGMMADRQFHQALYAQSGNDILAGFAGHLLDRSMRLWYKPPVSESRPNVAELEALCEKVRQGDRDGAVAIMREHIGSVRSKFLSR